MRTNFLQLLDLVLFLLQLLASYTRPSADEKILAEVRAAIEKLKAVRGTAVTKEQLEGLRLEVEWPDVPPAT
jgi:hypothetical protein